MPQKTSHAIALNDLCVSFGSFHAVDGLSLEAIRGELFDFSSPTAPATQRYAC